MKMIVKTIEGDKITIICKCLDDGTLIYEKDNGEIISKKQYSKQDAIQLFNLLH